MKTMTVKAISAFHGNLSRTFRVPAECGRFLRRCPNACDDAKDRKTGIQIHRGCGWPVCRTEWEAPEGFVVSAEWADKWDDAGRNNIVIIVEEKTPEWDGIDPDPDAAVAISSIEDLADFLGTEVTDLKRTVYKYTDCGAWIEWNAEGVTIGSIVEGIDGDGPVIPVTLRFPFTGADYRAAERSVEEQASNAWKETDDEEADGEDGNE